MGLGLRQIDDGLLAVVGGSEAADGALAVARALPLESDRLLVVMVGQVALWVPELAQRLRPWVHRGWESVRLVAGRAAAPLAHSPGQELADLLEIEVVAPDGELVVVPDGSLFVAAADGTARPGAWWRFRHGQPPVPVGARYPEPYWESDLAEFTDPGLPDIVVEQMPAGLWVRRPGEVKLTDLAFALPVEPRSVTLLVSRPGDAPIPALQFMRLVSALPDAVRDHLVAVPYGDEPVADFRLGAVAATAVDRSVRVRTGLALQVGRHRRTVFTVDKRGIPGWRPFVQESRWGPDGPTAAPLTWADPVRGLFPVRPGQLVLSRRWLVELVEAGLWIRPSDLRADAEIVRRIPLDSRRCMVVVGAPKGKHERPPWRTISRLLRQLPADARTHLQLAVPQGAGERLAYAAARMCGRELAGRPVQMLSADGEMTPQYVALPQSRLLSFFGLRPLVMRLADRPRGRFTSHRIGGRSTAAKNARRDRNDPEAVRLLTFIDKIRRTPAWDQPVDQQPSTSPQQPPPTVAGPPPAMRSPSSERATRRPDPVPLVQPRSAVDAMQVVNRVGRHRQDEEPTHPASATHARAETRPTRQARHRVQTTGQEDGR